MCYAIRVMFFWTGRQEMGTSHMNFEKCTNLELDDLSKIKKKLSYRFTAFTNMLKSSLQKINVILYENFIFINVFEFFFLLLFCILLIKRIVKYT